MDCGKCKHVNDADARYCVSCGYPFSGGAGPAAAKPDRIWRYLALLLPVLVLAGGLGYYKFALPAGVAAVVNGEEISLEEVDMAARDLTGRKDLPDEARSRMRYAVLSRIVTERIVCQEARKAGITVSQDELNAAIERRRTATGMEEKTFETQARERYGSVAAFRMSLERQLVIGKFIDEKVAAGAPDAASVSARMDQWVREMRGKAVVRIALAEELPAGGCGCCGGNAAGAPGRSCAMQKGQTAGAERTSPRTREAQKAALAYWQKRYGGESVDTRVRDFGCHIQVDIVQNDRIAKSLRYQNGTITEM